MDGRQRDALVDFLRGAAMLLVLLHHSGCPLGPYILAFHMPHFFVLSGYAESAFGGYAFGGPGSTARGGFAG